ncbi:MAG TPA: response regulator, partial [Paludibacter sp.]
ALNFVTSFIEISPGIFWLGSDGAGIQQYNLNTDAFEKNEALSLINSIAGKAVISLRKDKMGNVWMATYGKGLVSYNLHTKQILQYTSENSSLTSNNVWSLYIDKKDNLWIGVISGGGLFKFDYSKKVLERQDTKTKNVTNITESKNGKLLFAAFDNIGVYDPISKSSKLISTDLTIQSIYEDKKGTIWIGTERNGILKFNLQTEKLAPASDKLDYLKNSIIMAIVEDNYSNLWISTTNGLYRFHYPTEMLTTYNKEDGLQSQQFNYSSVLKTKNELLFFGGINGFSFFNPKNISVKTEDLPLHIIDFCIHNKSVFSDRKTFSDVIEMLSNKEVTIKHKDAYFRFDFTAISFNNPEKIQYAYMLEGLDKGWNYTGSNRSANYSGLSQGDYVFKVKYATQPGQWNNKLLEIKIHVLPPYYQTWWAYLLYLIIIGLIINQAIRIQTKQNKLKQDLLLADLKEEQAKQVQLMREQFFINISHELRTPLTLIIPPIKDSLNTNPYTPLSQIELQSVYNNANRLLLLINKLLLFRKNEMGKSQLRLTHSDLIDFAGKIYENFTQIARKRNVVYVFNAPKEPIPFWFDIDKMEIILYNLLSNAFKFTPEYGKIELIIRKESESTLVVAVRDNGSGISEDELGQIFNLYHSSNKFSGIGIGLSLVKDYAESLHGTLYIDSAPNKGSHFYINFDMNAKYEQSEMITDKPTVYLPSKDMVELVEIDTLLYLNQNKDENSDTLDSKLPKVLVVEDNPEILEYIKKILTETKMYDILEATNGKSALKIARKVLPEIIISDVHMPEMNGLELCKAIKENSETNHIYFIIITADLLESTENKGLTFGADEYITKPFDKSKLLNKITTIFNYQQKIRKYFDNKVILGNPKSNSETSTINTDFIDKCITLVKENYRSDEFNTQILAQQINMSQSALYKKIKLCTGKSINEFIRTVKLSIAIELITEGKLSITEIGYEVGINDPKYFRECFKKQYGVTPSEYKTNLSKS